MSKLPAWGKAPAFNLSDFYKGTNDRKIEEDLKAAQQEAETFAERYKGKLESLNGNELAAAIASYEEIQKAMYRPVQFIEASYMADNQAKGIDQMMGMGFPIYSTITETLDFVKQELGGIKSAQLKVKYDESEALRDWKPFIDEQRRSKAHRAIKAELAAAASMQNIRGKYDAEYGNLKFHFKGEELNLSDLTSQLRSSSEADRREAREELTRVLAPDSDFVGKATDMLNEVIQTKAISDQKRHFKSPLAERNFDNNLPDDVVDTMISTVTDNYSAISHRYNKLKASMFGGDKLEAHNQFASAPGADTTVIKWDKAKEIVVEAFADFSPTMAEYAKRMFDEGYVDAVLRDGKNSRPYAMPAYAKGIGHPLLLVNYRGMPQDVVDLGHEMGHVIHYWLAAEKGVLQAGTPNALAETASTFGEHLVFQRLRKDIKTPAERKALLMAKIESDIASIERQIQYVAFEKEAHEKGRDHKLTTEELDAMWLKHVKQREGDHFVPPGGERAKGSSGWATQTDFFHQPFYTYSFASGQMLVDAMLEQWQEKKIRNFGEKYLGILKAGGTKDYKELLASMKLSVRDPEIWKKSTKIRTTYLDELEQIVEQEKTAIAALEGANITTPANQQGYQIVLKRQDDENVEHLKGRTQEVANKLGAALGQNLTATRNGIRITKADGIINQTLHEMAVATREEVATETSR